MLFVLDELAAISNLLSKEGYLKEVSKTTTLAQINYKNEIHPIVSYTIGSTNPLAPTLLLVGGVHGLERIGAELCLTLLKTTIERLTWDENFRHLLTGIRLAFIPLLNPVGYAHFMRSNPKGVDLMRNAPVTASEKVPYLLGGHLISNKLPWFRGNVNDPEIETKALIDYFSETCLKSECLVSLDFHSGFGLKDRIWFPYSKSAKPFEHLPEMHAFTQLFEQSHPHHIYQIEPQSHGYLLHGDIWDYLFELYIAKNQGTFLPLTLEMGSWNWVKKNPVQFFSKEGLFNPVKQHRKSRTFRRHQVFFDFILRSLYSNKVWSDKDSVLRAKHESLAIKRWYGSSI